MNLNTNIKCEKCGRRVNYETKITIGDKKPIECNFCGATILTMTIVNPPRCLDDAYKKINNNKIRENN